jgi:predicted RNA-binding protein YlxR (DUF448 family)
MARYVVVGNQLRVGQSSDGRGVWVHRSRACVDAAIKSKSLERSLRRGGLVANSDEFEVEESAVRAGEGSGSQAP